MASPLLSEVFDQPGAGLVLLRAGKKFPPIEDGWQNKPHSFQEAAEHAAKGGNVGILAGNGYIGLDQDNPEAFKGLELPVTCTWETRPGRLGMWFKCSDVAEALQAIGRKPDQAQLKLFKDGKPCGEVKLERTYQVIPPSRKTLENGQRADYKLLQEIPPAEISLAKLLADLQALGITFSSKLEQNTARLESNAREARKSQAESDESRTRRYAEAALRDEVLAVADSPKGSRNEQLNKSAFALGQFVAAGVLSESEVERELSRAAMHVGLELEEIKATIASGLESGSRHPREIPEKSSPLDGNKSKLTGEDPAEIITEDELNSYSLPEGPKFECNLPADHFIQRFMAYGSDISDAYQEYWFAGGLFDLAVVADKKIKVSLKQGTIYPNLYISINGKSSLARKSTAVDKTEAMLCRVLPSLLSALVPTEFSPEAFTEHLSDHNHAPWIRDEAAGVLSLMKRDYMRGFKDTLMQLFDCKPFYRKLRTSQRKNAKNEFRVDDPYLNLLWATTDASLGANTEQNDTLSGFMARFLFFFPQGKKTKWMPLEEGTAANSIFEGVVKEQLAGISAKIAELPECTDMHFSLESAAYFSEWQRIREEEWTASNDGNAMQIYSRLAPAVVKLAMLFELGSSDFTVSRPIRPKFMKEACRLVDSYFMPTARAVYELVGANAEKNVIDRIVAYLKKHNGKATKKEIMRDVKIKSADFNEYLATMTESDLVETKTVKRGGKGRDGLWILLLDQSTVGNVATVAKIAKIAKVEEIPSKNDSDIVEGKTSTLATLATKPTSTILATKEQDSEKTDIKKTTDPGFVKFKAGMAKRKCCLCGRSFPYDLTPYVGGGKRGYICATCHMNGPPPEPAKADSQTKLEARG